uniref:Uncharacterized protein n=1 Tax=uncultured bacterium 5G4 TaxID=1701326 RepID=A0A166H2J6_9BACT|nr:hypothetical protein 5G4_003 [uncultured bacterium 5G4]
MSKPRTAGGTMFETGDVIINGAIAAILAGAVNLAFPWSRQRLRFLVVGVATFLGFIAWNLVISHANATGLDVDSQFLDLSWQDVGSGVLAFAASTLSLGIVEREEPALRCTIAAGVAGVAAMTFDIFVL